MEVSDDLPAQLVTAAAEWCECGHARDQHGETGTCLGDHRIENPDFFPGEAFTEHAECYCAGFRFWYADRVADRVEQGDGK